MIKNFFIALTAGLVVFGVSLIITSTGETENLQTRVFVTDSTLTASDELNDETRTLSIEDDTQYSLILSKQGAVIERDFNESSSTLIIDNNGTIHDFTY
jgi:hypothetical protein